MRTWGQHRRPVSPDARCVLPARAYPVSRRGQVKQILDRCHDIIAGELDSPKTREALAAHHAKLGKKGYDAVWSQRIREIMAVIEGGETHLARVLALVAGASERLRGWSLETRTYVALSRLVELPSTAAQKLHRGAITDAILSSCTKDTECVVEMGSGWGEHLFLLWLNGGPLGASYWALEPEAEGRKCSLILGTLEDAINLRTQYFNYEQPTFETLPAGLKDAVIYSVQSIEQVREVHPDLVARICDCAERVRVVHMEPVGWQMLSKSEFGEVEKRHRERCLSKRYNENLWSLLQAAQARGRIRITKSIPYFFGQDYNPTAFIAWEKA
jgi:hypothetical protein